MTLFDLRTSGPPIRRTVDLGRLHWTVRGRPVKVEWQSFDATAPGGYGDVNGLRILPRRGRRVHCWQGDRVQATRPNGKVLYEGRLIAPPKYVEDVAVVSARGPRSIVDQFADRLPYQIAGGDDWQGLDSDPANYTTNIVPDISPNSKGNGIGVKFGPATYAVNDRNGFYLWVEGYAIARVAGTIRKHGAQNANQDMRIRRAVPWGSATTISTFTLSDAANPDGSTFDVAFDASSEVAIIDWAINTAYSPTASRSYSVERVRVGVIATGDTFSTAQVAQDVASRCGYAVAATGSTNVLPLDWTSGATDLLDYVAAIEDSTWLVLHDPTGRNYGKLHLRAFGRRTWTTRLDGDAEDQGLTVCPLYDRYATTWESARGMPHKTTSKVADFGLRDPLPGRTFDYPEPGEIPDPQTDNTLALALNQRALRRLTTLRLEGQVKVNALRRQGVPFDILPGDLLRIGDFEPDVPAQRIAGVTYNRDGSVTCSLERDLRLDSMVRDVARKHTRHAGHRKRRRE